MLIDKKTESNVMRLKFIKKKQIKFEDSAPEAKEFPWQGISISGIPRRIRWKRIRKEYGRWPSPLNRADTSTALLPTATGRTILHVLAVSLMNSAARTASGLSRDGWPCWQRIPMGLTPDFDGARPSAISHKQGRGTWISRRNPFPVLMDLPNTCHRTNTDPKSGQKAARVSDRSR